MSTHPPFPIAGGRRVYGDPHLGCVLLEHRLGNAWNYTGTHAAARIELRTTPRAGGRVYFVRDDGAGFDMRNAAKIFTPFQPLHRLTGLPCLSAPRYCATRCETWNRVPPRSLP